MYIYHFMICPYSSSVTVIEVLPKERRQKEEKTNILGQCTVDLLPLVKGIDLLCHKFWAMAMTCRLAL